MRVDRELYDEYINQLTKSEREIIECIAFYGMTNREIAERRVTGRRGVETHVRNILAKLGLSTRLHIAVAVHTYGIPWVREVKVE